MSAPAPVTLGPKSNISTLRARNRFAAHRAFRRNLKGCSELGGIRPRTQLHTTRLGRALCLGGASIAGLGLLGWLAGMEPLRTMVPGRPPMMPDVALALLLL